MKSIKIVLSILAIVFILCFQVFAESFSEQQILNFEYTYQTVMAYKSTDATKVEYIGRAAPDAAQSDAAWQIKKITYDSDGNVSTIKYADGVATMTKKWSLRTTYTY